MSKVNIPKTQTAAVIGKIGGAIEIRTDHPVKQPDQLAPGECLVHIEATGCCHTDLHAAMGDWPVPPMTPLIGGHEGVGKIVAIGNHTNNSPVKVGDRVGIKWLADSCLNCDDCREGREQNCANAKLSGYTVDGTFQQYCVSFVNHVTPIPEGIDSDAAASILCAGVTVYRAIKYSQTNAGNWIVIPGAGGGLGHLAVQYAQIKGLRVIAIDTGAEKEKLVRSLGAEAWIDFKTSKNITQDIQAITEGRGAHAAVVTAATTAGYQAAIEYLRPGGKLMCVGLPANATLDASIFWTVFKSIQILGSYVGNRQDGKEALALAAAGKVTVKYATKPLSELTKVYDDMHKGAIAGRIVFDLHQ